MAAKSKPTVCELGIDLDGQVWRRAGDSPDSLEVAMVDALGDRWILVRVSGDPEARVLVYTEFEWDCFLDGAKGGEFDGTEPPRA